MIAALYVDQRGIYINAAGIDAWPRSRDAKNYRGPYPVIAHPPCQRWGRYWGGGPMLHGTRGQLLLGDDEQCFAHALWSVRTFGGVIEHPEATHAYSFYGLKKPNFNGHWTEADEYGGRACCVAQGNYGHRSQKMTWLYGVRIDFKELQWGRAKNCIRLEDGFHSTDERRRMRNCSPRPRIKKHEMTGTPLRFRDLLISLVNGV